MNAHLTHTISAARMILLIAVLTLGLVSGFQVASADDPNPDREGSGGVAGGDYPVLAGSGYENQGAVARGDQAPASDTLYESILAGSGYENEGAIAAGDQALASGTLYESILAGSGYEQTIAVAESNQAPASATLYESILAGSGYENHGVVKQASAEPGARHSSQTR